MKFIVSSSALLKQLQSLQGVLASSNTLAILDNFLFEIDNKKLTVTASDLETTITATMPVEAKDKGQRRHSARLLFGYPEGFPGAAPSPSAWTASTLASGSAAIQGNYKMTGFAGAEFPKALCWRTPPPSPSLLAPLATAINKTSSPPATTTSAR
ncbi:MAG: hypothetical protein IPO60_13855 [Flavobacteriales bacterium]|nr:hypothetical protein [Flavobacteriales bacterium]